MRGADTFTVSLFTMRHLGNFVPAIQPVRSIRKMVNEALVKMDALLGSMYEADIKRWSPQHCAREQNVTKINHVGPDCPCACGISAA